MQKQRSPLIAFLLAALLGPLGFTYTNLIGGLLSIILAVATLWTIFVPIIIWILCALFAPLIVMSYNKSVRTQKKYVDSKHEEIIKAIKSVNLRTETETDKSKSPPWASR